MGEYASSRYIHIPCNASGIYDVGNHRPNAPASRSSMGLATCRLVSSAMIENVVDPKSPTTFLREKDLN